MKANVHGGDRYGRQEMLDFSENVNPLGLPDSVRQALAQAIDEFMYYPDPLCRDLTAALAARENIPQHWIRFGNGAADLIYRAAFGLRPRRALLLAPTFAEYEAALLAAGCEVQFHILKEKDEFCLTDAILDDISPKLDLVVLCNPNNPTGQPAGRELLVRIAVQCAACGATLLLDECFVPFLDEPQAETMRDALGRFPNLLLLGAFTKIYAMAGLRLGWVFCADGAKLDALDACAPPWNISAPAQAAGLAALADTKYLARTRDLIREERAWLAKGLASCGVRVIGSQANYLFFHCQRGDLAQRLEERGILIRSCANYRGLDRHYCRVGVKTRTMNERLVRAMAEILKRK